ncbi:glycosyl hydrolase [Nocardioides sambongensis]|uniref:glycosyl hydrolase n=1 Tax=Nocardioides sambongensis TaxID=2589074 RepID=UPI0011273F33|nr:glycosyl hydrolase [Nocardioides sambongensis]
MNDPQSKARLDRRTLFGAAAAAVGAAAVASVSTGAVAPAPAGAGVLDGLPNSFERAFRRPTSATAAGFRWWWPHGLVDPAEISREVDQVADAGFGSLEVADVTHSLRARDIDIDVSTHGWGTAPWVAGVKAALRQGAKRDVRIDITVGPSWPAAVSTITPDDEAACTELVHGVVEVAAGATYDAELPEPVVEAADSVTKKTLVGVQAHRVAGQEIDSRGNLRSTTLDPESYRDLTSSVVDGRITWTAPAEPADGTWVLFAWWQRGSGQEPEAGPHTEPRSYVVDHFSKQGVQKVIELWEERILDREMRQLLKKAGGQLFEDSLEIETDATIWTPGFLETFEDSRGYDLRPWLPIVVEENEKYLYTIASADDPDKPESLRTYEIRDDYNQVLSDLYLTAHLIPLQDFAKKLGMGIRIQPYGLETDTMLHSTVIDVPETESLGFKNLDDYRIMASGRDIAGHTLLSCEAICYNGAAYNTGWGAAPSTRTQNQALFTINSIFVAGVNQLMIHGFPYATAPEVTWPGFAAFSPYYNGAIGYGEAWGPRTPQWKHIRGIADYIARTQMVLQTGAARYDMAFWRHKGWASTGIGPQWITNNGTKNGWSHSFLSASLLGLPAAKKVRDGRLAPDGPAYKVLLVGPDSLRSNNVTMDLEGARRILAVGKAGLPIILIGDWTAVTPVGRYDEAELAQVRSLMRQIAALPKTRTVVEAEIPTALADLGIVSDVEHTDSTVQHVRRVDGKVDYYYIANVRHAEANRNIVRATQDIWLTATDKKAVPFLLDAWTGQTTRVAAYERNGDRIRVRIDLVPGASTIIALAPKGFTPDKPIVPIATAGQEVFQRGLVTTLRTTTAGSIPVTRTGGRTVEVEVDRVVAPITPTAWTLEVEDWKPANEADPTDLRTTKETHETTLDALGSWSQVEGLEDVSGIGRYRTTVELDKDWKRHEDGAFLELGEVNDTFRVRVNGELLPALDPMNPTIDLGHRLRRGTNTIEVEVASTLLNRLRVVTPEVYGVAQRQSYGLVGPVRLVPYVEKVVLA